MGLQHFFLILFLLLMMASFRRKPIATERLIITQERNIISKTSMCPAKPVLASDKHIIE